MRDGSGHSKPTHLHPTVVSVQDGGVAVVLNDLTMAIESTSHGGPFTSLAANVLFPAGKGIDGLFVNGVRVENINSPGAPDIPVKLGTRLFLVALLPPFFEKKVRVARLTCLYFTFCVSQ